MGCGISRLILKKGMACKCGLMALCMKGFGKTISQKAKVDSLIHPVTYTWETG